jgi:hypothetical protein
LFFQFNPIALHILFQLLNAQFPLFHLLTNAKVTLHLGPHTEYPGKDGSNAHGNNQLNTEGSLYIQPFGDVDNHGLGIFDAEDDQGQGNDKDNNKIDLSHGSAPQIARSI